MGPHIYDPRLANRPVVEYQSIYDALRHLCAAQSAWRERHELDYRPICYQERSHRASPKTNRVEYATTIQSYSQGDWTSSSISSGRCRLSTWNPAIAGSWLMPVHATISCSKGRDLTPDLRCVGRDLIDKRECMKRLNRGARLAAYTNRSEPPLFERETMAPITRENAGRIYRRRFVNCEFAVSRIRAILLYAAQRELAKYSILARIVCQVDVSYGHCTKTGDSSRRRAATAYAM